MVSPSAASPAMTSDTDARRSVAMTRAEPRLREARPGARALHAAAGHGHRHGVGAGLDPIGQHGMPRAVKLCDALDDDARRAGADDPRAHLVQAIGDV